MSMLYLAHFCLQPPSAVAGLCTPSRLPSILDHSLYICAVPACIRLDNERRSMYVHEQQHVQQHLAALQHTLQLVTGQHWQQHPQPQ